MNTLITLLIYVIVFGIIGYGLWWVCAKFALPQPVMWIVGAILLIFLLVFLGGQLGVGNNFHFGSLKQVGDIMALVIRCAVCGNFVEVASISNDAESVIRVYPCKCQYDEGVKEGTSIEVRNEGKSLGIGG